MRGKYELMKRLVEHSNTPGLSLAWSRNNKLHVMAYGKTDISTSNHVNRYTRFQAASLSKPVSAAIVLDLVAQGKWDLDTPLADIADYGPVELRDEPHYHILTTRMIIGQCSGLANFGQDGDDGKKFIATPNTRFTYSGVALDFLKDVIEQKTGHSWDVISQDFFKRLGMKNSSFRLEPEDINIAKAHELEHSLPVPSGNQIGIPAGGLFTTGEDYIAFLQYCFKNEYLRETLLTGALSTLPPTDSPDTSDMQWGLGMGIYNDKSTGKTIAFHWGFNPGSISFCAIEMESGDCVVSFSNSRNGPAVFQMVSEPIVGDMNSLFNWLSTYAGFRDATQPHAPDLMHDLVHSLQGLEGEAEVKSNNEIIHRFKRETQQSRAGYMEPTISSKAKEREPVVSSPFSTKPKLPWKP